jgi:hypothetical protein
VDLLCVYPGPYTVQDRQHGALDRGLPTAEGFWVGKGAREMMEGVGGGLLYCEKIRAEWCEDERSSDRCTMDVRGRCMLTSDRIWQVTLCVLLTCAKAGEHLRKRPEPDGCINGRRAPSGPTPVAHRRSTLAHRRYTDKTRSIRL